MGKFEDVQVPNFSKNFFLPQTYLSTQAHLSSPSVLLSETSYTKYFISQQPTEQEQIVQKACKSLSEHVD